MPAISSTNLTRLRTTQHATKLALVVYAPAAIWTCQVNGAQATGARYITVDNVVNVRSPQKNFHVLFGSAAGLRDLGEARLLGYTAPTLLVSTHNAPLADNTFITVLEEIKPDSIHVSINNADVVTEDSTYTYTDENVKYMPLARCGTHAVAYIDPTSGVATVKFYSRASAYAGTLASHLWTWRGGTITTGSTTTAGTSASPNIVTWDTAGDYYCSYQVTDSNGKTHTRYFVVFIRAYNAANVYTNLEVSGMDGEVESGIWKTTLNVITNAGAAAFPSNALCVLFAEDWYGSEKVSIGSGNDVYRENIVFAGYIRHGTTKADWAKSSVKFEVESVSGVMSNLWSLAGGLESVATPTGWHQLSGMTYNLAAHHILTQHSTISQITDCYLNLPTYTIEFIDIRDASLAENIRNLCGLVRGRMGCNAQGHLYIEANPQLTSLASRSSTYTIQTINADIRDEIDFGDEVPEKIVAQIDFCAQDANADPVFSLAPAVPWTHGRTERIDGISVASQTESNEFSGLYEGYRNNAFADVTINWRGNYRVLDIYPAEPIAVNISANQNARGIAWSTQRCWIKRIGLTYQPGTLLVSTTVEKDSYGSPGITGDYPVVPPIVPPPPPPPYIDPPIDPPIVVPPGGLDPNDFRNKMFAATSGMGIYYTTNFKDAVPTWTTVNTGLPDLFIKSFTADPFSPSTRQWCITGAWELYSRTSGNWSLQFSIANALTLFGFSTGFYNRIESVTPNIAIPGYVAVIFMHAMGGGGETYYYAYSTDYGATWQKRNAIPIGSNFNGNVRGFAHGLYRGSSSYAAGNVVYLTSYSGGGGTNRLWVSVDKGATWIERTGFNAATGASVIQLDLAQDVIYSYTNTGIKRSLDRGATWTLISPSTEMDLMQRGQLQSAYQIIPAYDATAPVPTRASIINAVGYSLNIWTTQNGGASWTMTTLNTSTWRIGVTAHEPGIFLNGDAQNKLYGICLRGAIGGNGLHVIQTSEDGGATWTLKCGADVSDTTVNGIPSSQNIIQILPVYL